MHTQQEILIQESQVALDLRNTVKLNFIQRIFDKHPKIENTHFYTHFTHKLTCFYPGILGRGCIVFHIRSVDIAGRRSYFSRDLLPTATNRIWIPMNRGVRIFLITKIIQTANSRICSFSSARHCEHMSGNGIQVH